MLKTIFCDLGGVILSNGWDRPTRKIAAEQFGLDVDDFQDRHEHVVDDFETGRMTLEKYLERTVFYKPRSFSAADFRAFMFEQSRELAGTLEFVRELRQQVPLLAVLNNESLELNEYRIRTFHLADSFPLFFSSCYVRLRKPDTRMYALALQVTQTGPADALLIDDRAINVEAARSIGMQAIEYKNLAQLRDCLAELGTAV